MRVVCLLWLLLLSITASHDNATSQTAFKWMRESHWVFPEDLHPKLTDRLRYCRVGVCTRQIGTPESVLSLLVPFVQGRMLCDIGCRTGDVLQLMKNHASRLYGIEINPRYARTAKQQGLPVVIGDFLKVPLPSGCQTVYFWVKATLMEKFLQHVTPILKAKAGSTIILPAEFMEYRELQALLKVRERHGGELFKVPFHEGSGFRQFGVILFLILRPAGSTAADTPLLTLTPRAFQTGVAHFRKFGWLFHAEAPDMKVPDSGPGISRTSLSALRALAQGRHFCDLYARDGMLLRRMAPHVASVHGLVDKPAELAVARGTGHNVSTYSDGVPAMCNFFFVSHTLEFHLRVTADLTRMPAVPGARRTLVVATHLLDRVGTFRFWAAHQRGCRMHKILGDDDQRGVSVVVFFVFDLDGGP